MGKRKKDKEKKKRHIGKIIFVIILILLIFLGSFFGYLIYRNGGGMQGLVATVLGQDEEKLQNLDPLNVLILRS